MKYINPPKIVATGTVDRIEGDTVYAILTCAGKEYSFHYKLIQFPNPEGVKKGAVFDVEEALREDHVTVTQIIEKGTKPISSEEVLKPIKSETVMSGRVIDIENETVYAWCGEDGREYNAEYKFDQFKNPEDVEKDALFGMNETIFEKGRTETELVVRKRKPRKPLSPRQFERMKQDISDAFYEGDLDKLNKIWETDYPEEREPLTDEQVSEFRRDVKELCPEENHEKLDAIFDKYVK